MSDSSISDELWRLAAAPETPPATIAQLAYEHPELRATIAANPAAYNGLLEWLRQFDDPEIMTALDARAERLTGAVTPALEPLSTLPTPAATSAERAPTSWSRFLVFIRKPRIIAIAVVVIVGVAAGAIVVTTVASRLITASSRSVANSDLSTPTESLVPSSPPVVPFDGLPGPAPVADPSYDRAKIWLADGSTYYTVSQIEQCKALGLDEFLVRLTPDPAIQQPQMSSTALHCAWRNVEADIDAPISQPATQGWNYLVGGSPNSFTDLGPVEIGTDTDVIQIPLVGGGNRFFGTAKTTTLVFYVSIFDTPGAAVTPAFYKGAIQQMLAQMVMAGTAMGPNLTPLTKSASPSPPTCDEAKPIFGHFNPGADAAWADFSFEYFHGDEKAADGWAYDKCALSYE